VGLGATENVPDANGGEFTFNPEDGVGPILRPERVFGLRSRVEGAIFPCAAREVVRCSGAAVCHTDRDPNVGAGELSDAIAERQTVTCSTRRLCALVLCVGVPTLASAQSDNPRHQPLEIGIPEIGQLRVNLLGGGYGERDNCPVTSSYTDASFSGGTYTAQGGFAEGEIAAVSYTLPAVYFPLRFQMVEFIFAQQNASVTTTTEWSVLVWDGRPNEGVLVAEFNSDGSILPHIVMGPGTRGVNVQASVDANDPEQVFILNPNNDPTHTFTVGVRVDRHNAQTSNPCVVAPPSTLNAFPVTDNTVIGCGSGYGQLNFPTENWLFGVNCGPNGCPPNGGWTRFSGLQADQNIFGICITGCRPRGDWVMRVTWDPVNCPPQEGACCFGTSGCFPATQTQCQQSGGSWRGPGTVCGTPDGGQFPGCVAPANTAPVAVAGVDQVATDTDNDGTEAVIVDGSSSFDPDAGDFIASYRWSEGATILQDGPALLSTTLPVGVHTLTLRVSDSIGANAADEVIVTINPGAGSTCDADVNCDGSPDQGDVACMILAIAGDASCICQDPDFNLDGSADQGDVAALIGVVAGQPCP